jgi:hypothetical protein
MRTCKAFGKVTHHRIYWLHSLHINLNDVVIQKKKLMAFLQSET